MAIVPLKNNNANVAKYQLPIAPTPVAIKGKLVVIH
jgi:hypothetical protein